MIIGKLILIMKILNYDLMLCKLHCNEFELQTTNFPRNKVVIAFRNRGQFNNSYGLSRLLFWENGFF
jgi:hypothetical protein